MAVASSEAGEGVVGVCLELGFALAGIAPAAPSRWSRELAAWLGGGRHGEMGYLERHLEVRLDPGRLLPGARSIVMVADVYAARGDDDGALAPGHGRIARYARGRDYHRVMKRRLLALSDALRARHPAESFRAFVDTAPVLEREHAQRAGLGWIGKHTLLIHPRLGSYTLLGGVATTLAIAPAAAQEVVEDHCGTCTRCIDACPTGAITPYSVDATRCVSYLTIEHRGRIDPGLHAGIGEWIYGCDICQEVCPHNSARPTGASPREEYRSSRASLPLLEVLGWGREDRGAALAGSAMKRANLEMMKRNALIVAGNLLAGEAAARGAAARLHRSESGATGALRARIVEIGEDEAESELVRRTARDVLAGL